MKNYEYIFWDFDGTLVDTRKGTRESARYALKHFNKNIKKNGPFRRYILWSTIERFF